jgi:hypothetical protein
VDPTPRQPFSHYDIVIFLVALGNLVALRNQGRHTIFQKSEPREATSMTHDPDFENPEPVLASLNAPQNLKFEQEDWTQFRHLDGLQQRAGVRKELLPVLVIKELVDNALDEAEETGSIFGVKFGRLDDGRFYVQDRGRGIAPEETAQWFRINRPMLSTKRLRKPTRGVLGNGLRVVAGAVLASEGSLVVISRNQRVTLQPERDGTTTVVKVEPIEFPNGTRIEIGFGPALPININPLAWAHIASHLAFHGSHYQGKSSSWWYDASQFCELMYTAGATPVRELIASLDGCSGGKAGEIVNDAGLGRTLCREVTREQAKRLLITARGYANQVNPKRLGAVGPNARPSAAYSCANGIVRIGSAEPYAEIPYVAECQQRSDFAVKLSV